MPGAALAVSVNGVDTIGGTHVTDAEFCVDVALVLAGQFEIVAVLISTVNEVEHPVPYRGGMPSTIH